MDMWMEEREGDGWVGKWRDRRENRQMQGRIDRWMKGLKKRVEG